MLAAAFVRLRPFRAFGPWRRTGVAGLLAATQLERRPEQYTAIALVLAASAGIGVFTIAAFLGQLGVSPAGLEAIRTGAEAGLLAGAMGALILALSAFAFHFRWALRRRLVEYGGLFAHGLPSSQVSASLAAEQRAVTWSSLLVGGLLGVGLAVTNLPPPGGSPSNLAAIALGAGAFLAALLVGTLLIGAVVRRLPNRVKPVPDPWLR
jgi:hypothetical protein